MIYLSAFALIFLIATSIVLLRNIFDFENLPLDDNKADYHTKVSICIPARNEEISIDKCVTSACELNYEQLEVLVLDDQSDDRTPIILDELAKQYPDRLTIINGTDKPAGWLGKPYACHQLSQKADGDILIFIDADTILEKNTVAKVVTALERDNLDFITIWPFQILGSVSEKIVIPLVYHALLTLLPAVYTERKPKWLPTIFHKRYRDLFAAACGQFVAFKRKAYDHIDGHVSVKDKIVEDVELAKAIRRNQLSMKMYFGADDVACRMYRGHSELWQGFRKNFFAGFGYNYIGFISMALLHLIVFVLPFFTIGMSIWGDISPFAGALASGAVILMVGQRLILDYKLKWKLTYSCAHILGVLWFQALGIQCIIDKINNTKVLWKQRSV